MDLIEEFLFEAFPNPERKDCPDEETIMSLAKNDLRGDHPACLHVVSCSECFAEYCGCLLELENQNSVDAKAVSNPRQYGPAEQRARSMDWSQIASGLSTNDETQIKAIQRLRERIAELRHRYSR